MASGDRNYVCAYRLLLPANLIMAVLSTKELLLSSLSTPQLKAIMASSQGFTFLSGASTFAALSFYRPSQNPAVEPNVHWTGRLYSIVVGSGITRGFIATTIQLGCFVTVRVTTLYDVWWYSAFALSSF